MKQQLHPLILLGIILGGSFLIATLVGSMTVFRLRSLNDTVSVTGSAKVDVTADQAKWITQISRTVREANLKSGYEQLARDLVVTKKFMASQQITDAEINTSPVSMNEVYQQNQSAEKLYSLTQTLTVSTMDVDRLTAASKNIATVVGQNVIFSSLSLEYYYSKLPETRITLLSQAIDDAKARAGEIAKNSGKGVGTLKSASSGVVQVQSRNSTDVSDYGSYDTSQIEKQVTVTVKAAFSLK